MPKPSTAVLCGVWQVFVASSELLSGGERRSRMKITIRKMIKSKMMSRTVASCS